MCMSVVACDVLYHAGTQQLVEQGMLEAITYWLV